MPLSIETLRELAKLTELKTKGGIPEPHFELLKAHIKQRGTLTREAWEVFGLAWNLKVDGVLTEDEYAEQVDEGVASILKTGATVVSPGENIRPPPVSAKSSAAGSKKAKKAAVVGDGGGETTKKKRAAKDGSNAKAASAGPVRICGGRMLGCVPLRPSACVWRRGVVDYCDIALLLLSASFFLFFFCQHICTFSSSFRVLVAGLFPTRYFLSQHTCTDTGIRIETLCTCSYRLLYWSIIYCTYCN